MTHQLGIAQTENDRQIDPTLYTQHLSVQNYNRDRYTTHFPDINKRHFNAFQEFYFHQTERMSAFQYVKHQDIDAYIKRYVNNN